MLIFREWSRSKDVYFFITMLHLVLFFYFSNFGFWMSSIFIVKFLDISFKLSIMKKLSNGVPIERIMEINVKMTPVLRYFNVIVYPLTFLFAIKLI